MSNGILDGNVLGASGVGSWIDTAMFLTSPVSYLTGRAAAATIQGGQSAVQTVSDTTSAVKTGAEQTVIPIVDEAQENFFQSKAALYLAMIIGGALIFSAAKKKQSRRS